MTDAASLERYLSSAPRFVSLCEVLTREGDALTIDDAVRGAADAALMARRHGHAVTLFVNPGQVQSAAPYAFVALSALLDGLDGRPCDFQGERFDTMTSAGRQALRRRIKGQLRTIAEESRRLDFVTSLERLWQVHPVDVPPHFRTLDREDLVALRDAGVDLQNHGWTHTDHEALSGPESVREIRDGRAWLQRELGLDAPYFAVPLGEALPKGGVATACEAWFLLSDALPPGPLSSRVFNRQSLDLEVAAPLRASLRTTIRRFLNLWRSRLSSRMSS